MCTLVAAFIAAPGASAAVLPTERIDGPSPDVLELGGVAMADDGTGGAVYRRRDGGRAHIFVSRFTGSGWERPTRVDIGQEFESNWPRIAAASGGRLLVTWTQPVRRTVSTTISSLYGAWKAPGAARFSAPTIIDPNVGDAAGLFPTLTLAANGGSGFLTYVRQEGEVTEFRLAQFRGGVSWRRSAIPRRSNRPLSRLNADTAPKVAADAVGNAVVGYVEPDQDNVDRVYARRVFGGDLTVVPLQASPSVVDGRPVTGPADQFALGIGGFGEAIVAVRQQLDAASAVTRVFVNTLPPVFSEGAAAFSGARPMDPPAPGTPNGVAAATFSDGGGFRMAYGLGSTFVLATSPDGVAFGAPVRVGTPGNVAPGAPEIALGPKGAGVVVRKLTIGGSDGVEIRELTAGGSQRRAQVSSTRGGLVTGVDVAGSGAGDGLVAFRSESNGAGEVSGVTVDAPPLPFAVTTPTDWVRPALTRVRWDTARNTLGRVLYELFLDGTKVTESRELRQLRLPRAGLDDGRHRVVVRVVDRVGQRTVSNTATLRVDGTPPVATVTRHRNRRVRVRITDSGRSGLDREQSTVTWGDGERSAAANPVSHTYRRACRCTVTVKVVDRAGNRRTTRHKVTVR